MVLCLERCADQHFRRVVPGADRNNQRNDTANRQRLLHDFSPLRGGEQPRLLLSSLGLSVRPSVRPSSTDPGFGSELETTAIAAITPSARA